MSLRQRQFIKFLPECNNNIAQAGIKAGYSESYAKSKLYQKVNQGKFKIETEDDIKKQYLKEVKKAKKLMLKNKDNTNYLRAMEIDGKVKGLFKETVVNEGNQKEITVVYGNTDKPIVQANDNDTNLVSINPINNTPYNNTVLDTPKDTKVLEDNGKVEDRVGGGSGE